MKKLQLTLGALLISSLVFTGCTGKAASSGVTTIKIAAAGPITGQYAKIGMDGLNAVRFAVDEFNASGVLKDLKVEVVPADDEGDPSKGLTVADRLAQDRGVVAVVGPMNSSVVNSVLTTYERAGLPMISQSATTSDLNDQGYKVFFRVCPRDDAQGPAAASFITQDLKAKSVVIIDDKSTYGQGLAVQVEEGLKAAGIVTTRVQITQADRDFAPLVTVLKKQQPDLAYLAVSAPAQAAAIVKQARSQGFAAEFMGGEAIREPEEFVKAAEGMAEGIYLTSISPNLESTPQGSQFLKSYVAKHGATSMFTGQSYEAAKVLLDAIKKAASSGKVDRESVLKSLQGTKDYQGVLGFPITFNAKGDLAGAGIYVERVTKGAFAEVKVIK